MFFYTGIFFSMKTAMNEALECRLEEHRITNEPFFLAQTNEIEIGPAVSANRLPLLLKGPIGCGETRFMSYPPGDSIVR